MSISYKDLNLTTFPEGIDDFPQWLDITAADGPLVKQYMEAMQDGDSVKASQILAMMPNATQKVIRATDLNKLTQAMLAIERFYNSDIKGYIEAKQEEWLKISSEFAYIGEWFPYKTYFRNNMVGHTSEDGRFIYIALKDVPTGTPPSNTEYWGVFTIQGPQGPSGPGMAYRQQWFSSITYQVNDAVTYNGSLWQAIQQSTNEEPSLTSNAWKLVMSLATTTYPVQDTQPEGQPVGGLWFNIGNR